MILLIILICDTSTIILLKIFNKFQMKFILVIITNQNLIKI